MRSCRHRRFIEQVHGQLSSLQMDHAPWGRHARQSLLQIRRRFSVLTQVNGSNRSLLQCSQRQLSHIRLGGTPVPGAGQRNRSTHIEDSGKPRISEHPEHFGQPGLHRGQDEQPLRPGLTQQAGQSNPQGDAAGTAHAVLAHIQDMNAMVLQQPLTAVVEYGPDLAVRTPFKQLADDPVPKGIRSRQNMGPDVSESPGHLD